MIIEDRELEGKILTKYLYYLQSLDPILSKISVDPDLHRGGVRYKSEDKELIIPKTRIGIEIKFGFNDLKNYNISKFCEQIYSFSSDYIKEIFKMFIETMNKITEFTGNVTDAQGAEVNYDLMLDNFEKLEFDFDKKGNPIFPTLFVGSELFEKIKQLRMTSEQEERFRIIIEGKKKKYYASKCYRRLSYIN